MIVTGVDGSGGGSLRSELRRAALKRRADFNLPEIRSGRLKTCPTSLIETYDFALSAFAALASSAASADLAASAASAASISSGSR